MNDRSSPTNTIGSQPQRSASENAEVATEPPPATIASSPQPLKIQSSIAQFADRVRNRWAGSSNSAGCTVAALTAQIWDRSQPAKW